MLLSLSLLCLLTHTGRVKVRDNQPEEHVEILKTIICTLVLREFGYVTKQYVFNWKIQLLMDGRFCFLFLIFTKQYPTSTLIEMFFTPELHF